MIGFIDVKFCQGIFNIISASEECDSWFEQSESSLPKMLSAKYEWNWVSGSVEGF